MSIRRAALALLALLAPLNTAAAQAQLTPEHAVRAVTYRMFDGMRRSDSTMVRSTLAPGARFASVDARATPPVIKYEPPDAWLAGIANSNGRWDERLSDVQVRVDGNIAQVWAAYTFYLDGKIRHCGVDAMELLLESTGWKITQLSDTQRREGCREIQGSANDASAPERPYFEFQVADISARGFPTDSAVLAIIRQRVEEKRSAGIVVGLLEPDGRTRVIAYGDPGPGQPALDGNSVFEIGSITKVFTATVLAQLVQDGKVKLDDPVQRYLPSTVTVPTRNGKAITLGSLSEQNSGLPRMPNNFRPADPANPYVDYGAARMYEFLSGYQLPRDPGALFEYSNLGVGLLGHALSLATGQSYENLQRERVWKPLGMEHTAITLTPWMKSHLALGHDVQGGLATNWDLDVLAGAGAIRSTTYDMLRFADANLHPERGALQRAMRFAQQRRAAAGPAVGIGLNWIIQPAGTDTIVWHNGGTGGYRTYLGLLPSRKMAVVVMTNSTGAGADDIGAHLLVPTIPLAPKPAPMKQRTAIDVSAAVLQGAVTSLVLHQNGQSQTARKVK
ncbi:MAG TPA: serine hydrolase [Gemmatimonadaceae bacterium]|nr:serine hydrolase [Gemmatimonadaceae bacterium]